MFHHFRSTAGRNTSCLLVTKIVCCVSWSDDKGVESKSTDLVRLIPKSSESCRSPIESGLEFRQPVPKPAFLYSHTAADWILGGYQAIWSSCLWACPEACQPQQNWAAQCQVCPPAADAALPDLQKGCCRLLPLFEVQQGCCCSCFSSCSPYPTTQGKDASLHPAWSSHTGCLFFQLTDSKKLSHSLGHVWTSRIVYNSFAVGAIPIGQDSSRIC